ncbi:hypothetical protein ACFQL7_07635 [Halocatena marina]|uniref:Uncharacterized protein n=1 Tax=Halocatena marina TaxID=2934937 RepID=A0ABD5YLH1_9EURY
MEPTSVPSHSAAGCGPTPHRRFLKEVADDDEKSEPSTNVGPDDRKRRENELIERLTSAVGPRRRVARRRPERTVFRLGSVVVSMTHGPHLRPQSADRPFRM